MLIGKTIIVFAAVTSPVTVAAQQNSSTTHRDGTSTTTVPSSSFAVPWLLIFLVAVVALGFAGAVITGRRRGSLFDRR